MGTGYFTPAAEVKPLLHTWSLAVEEQFYLFFPFLLFGLVRFARRFLVLAILLLAGISFFLSVYCSYVHPSTNFYFLPTRAWELLIGAFLASIPAQQRASARYLTELLSLGGLLAILFAVFFYDSETRFPGVSALFPCVGAALIIWANGHTLTSSGKFLALRPVVFIGLISYSLYLWHWPVLVFARYWAIDPLSPSQRVFLLLGSLVLSVLSWRFVETPFRKRVILKTRTQVFGYAGAASALVLFAALTVYKLQGVPSRLPADALRYVNGERNSVFEDDLSLKQVQDEDFVELGTGDQVKPVELLVWGDSHAMSAMPLFDILCKEYSVRGVAATRSATVPVLGYESKKADLNLGNSISFNNAIVDYIRGKSVSNVIIVARWDSYPDSVLLSRCLLETLDVLMKSGVRVFLMKTVPKQRWNVPRVLGIVAWRGGDPEKFGLPLSEHYRQSSSWDAIMEGISEQYSDVMVLDPTGLFVTDNLCRAADSGRALYQDEHHLTVEGAMLLRPLFEPTFQNIDRLRK